jgi:hypothetical protein
MRDDFGTLEELIPPHVVAVLVRVDDAPRRTVPDPAEELDHTARVVQVALRIDHDAAAPIDEARVRVAYAVSLIHDGETVVADLLQIQMGCTQIDVPRFVERRSVRSAHSTTHTTPAPDQWGAVCCG